MPKRKRSSESPSTGDRALDIKISRLKVRLEQGISQLKKALTLARGFERQKLGRRQKAATKEPKELLRLREEVIVLKQLDLSTVAERQLFKRLGKVKRITEHPAFQHVYGSKDVERPKNDAESRVVGRLMNSNPVKECLPGLVDTIFGVLGIEEQGPKSDVKITGGKQAVVDGIAEPKATQPHGVNRPEYDEWSGSGSDIEAEVSLDDDMASATGEDENVGEADDQDRLSGSNDFSGLSDRLVASSEDELEHDNLAPKTLSNMNGSNRARHQSRSPSVEVPLSSLSASLEPKGKKSEAQAFATTTFLGSIMGGYYSGSESASDIEDVRNKPRKNRRGQRERQKIAEAKFGAGAKHLAKQNAGRSAGWDPKRGATDRPFNSKGKMRIGRTNTKGPTGANGDTLGTKRAAAVKEAPMHPSWEAARKRKEQGKISIDTAMGKKITFD